MSFSCRRMNGMNSFVYLIFVLLLAVGRACGKSLSANTCPTNTIRVYNQDIDKVVCCNDIQCRIGEQPHPCDGKNPVPSCRPCQKGTYQKLSVKLSDDPYNKCRMKTKCDYYKDRGSTSEDAICKCPPGKFDAGDGICLPSPSCPPGFGLAESGKHCERCTENVNYSSHESNTEPCKPVTDCKSLGRCTLKYATTASDNTCSTERTYNLGDCAKPTPSPKPPMTTISEPTMPTSMSPRPESNTMDTGLKIGISVFAGIIFVIFLVIFICCLVPRIRSRKRMDKEYEVLEKRAKQMSDVKDDAVREEAFDIFVDYLADEKADKMEPLGMILLGNDANGILCTIKDKSITAQEKMREMLGTWRERSLYGPDFKTLVDVMYSRKNRNYFGFRSLAPEIEMKYGTTLGVPKVKRVQKESYCSVLCRFARDEKDTINSLERLIKEENVTVEKDPLVSQENDQIRSDVSKSDQEILASRQHISSV